MNKSHELLKPIIPSILPILPLSNAVLFPYEVLALQVGTERNLRMFQEVGEEEFVGLVTIKEIKVQSPENSLEEDISENNADKLTEETLYNIGTAAKVIQKINMPSNTIQVVFQGIQRIKLLEIIQVKPYIEAKVEPIVTKSKDSVQINALIADALLLLKELVKINQDYSQELVSIMNMNMEEPGRFADMLASSLYISPKEKQEILSLVDCTERLKRLIEILTSSIKEAEVALDIEQKVQIDMDKDQREYYLRQQLQAIKQELGEEDPQEAEIERLRNEVEKIGLPSKVKEETIKEINRLSMVSPMSPESEIIRTYIDWIINLPWNKSSKDNLLIEKARKILDEDHYGLEKVKERIIEFLSVMKLKKDAKGPILCLAGPPGVGKTSLGKSIARAIGRKFIRISVGGVRDEAEIKGHRRTYIGAMPGKIIQSIKRAGTNNPLFMIDEIDKIGTDYRGDPASALLEALDPEQNYAFADHYIDLPFDLSRVFFITTANMLHTIPPALRDRMEVIEISGYTPEEKLEIAKRYIIPKQIKATGLSPDNMKISDAAIKKIITSYTLEAGLRELERTISSLARKIATQVAVSKKKIRKVIEENDLEEMLGPVIYLPEIANRKAEVGVATGLAWTSVGGDIMFIEATKMKGRGNVIMTGQLGQVMEESVRAAISYVRSHSPELEIPDDAFDKYDIHIHFPEGAVPKDGPSAGIAIVTALISLFTERPVKPDLAMTGEITLKGKVIVIGGLKEKVLAAYRAGITQIAIPTQNEKDLIEIPKEIKEKMRFIFIDDVSQIIPHALSPIITPTHNLEKSIQNFGGNSMVM